MNYIQERNLTYHNDKLATLEYLRDLAESSTGDAKIQESILSKIAALTEELESQVAETMDEDGTIRVRHPSIGVVTFSQSLTSEPLQLFGSPIKSLTVTEVNVCLAEALISPDGVIRYQPYETIATFQLSDAALSSMITDIGGGTAPATILKAKGYDIEPYVPDAMTVTASRLQSHLRDTLEDTAQRFEQFIGTVTTEIGKGGKLSAKATAQIMKDAHTISTHIASNPTFALMGIGEYSDAVRMTAQLEIEAALRLSSNRRNQ